MATLKNFLCQQNCSFERCLRMKRSKNPTCFLIGMTEIPKNSSDSKNYFLKRLLAKANRKRKNLKLSLLDTLTSQLERNVLYPLPYLLFYAPPSPQAPILPPVCFHSHLTCQKQKLNHFLKLILSRIQEVYMVDF